jgi:hypothetical protein
MEATAMATAISGIVVAQAVQILASILKDREFGAGAAGNANRLRAWMHDRLTGRASEALQDVEILPSEDNLADLRKQLARQIDAEPNLSAELQELLPTWESAETARLVGRAMEIGNIKTGAFKSEGG